MNKINACLNLDFFCWVSRLLLSEAENAGSSRFAPFCFDFACSDAILVTATQGENCVTPLKNPHRYEAGFISLQ